MSAGSDILHLSAAQPAGNLLEMLNEDGFVARRRYVYEAVHTGTRDPEEVAARLSQIATILIHSPRAGRYVAGWLYRQLPL